MTSRRRKKLKRNPKTTEALWREQPTLIRQFIEKRTDFEQLCAEVAYILQKTLKEANIEISTVSSRAKTLNSFLEKLQRKNYDDPFKEITDFAGARAVCLYVRDISVIEQIIRREFEVLEKVDKMTDKGADRFGYGAIHFIVTLGKTSAGARYDDLKDLVCEIQVRTVLQDAWAIIDHHLVYKSESDIPTHIQRKLNSLAGLFETADDQFDRVRFERESYLTNIRNSKNNPTEFLENEINKDTITEYLTWKFPDLSLEKFPGQIDLLLKMLNEKYKTLSDIDSAVEATSEVRKKVKAQLSAQDYSFAPIEVALALGIADKAFRDHALMPEDWATKIRKHV